MPRVCLYVLELPLTVNRKSATTTKVHVGARLCSVVHGAPNRFALWLPDPRRSPPLPVSHRIHEYAQLLAQIGRSALRGVALVSRASLRPVTPSVTAGLPSVRAFGASPLRRSASAGSSGSGPSTNASAATTPSTAPSEVPVWQEYKDAAGYVCAVGRGRVHVDGVVPPPPFSPRCLCLC